mmetsp:Transcript_45441/g.176719  ORF Transcript_45441/g.176719 Transcript_45441/m.176719 type:complete len:99 (-) Transcript_45441:1767-2063(-)
MPRRYLEEKPYIKAMVEFYDDEEPTEDISEVELNVWSKLQDVLRLSNKLYDKRQEFGERMTKVAPGDGMSSLVQSIWYRGDLIKAGLCLSAPRFQLDS